jgi:hypothetical protein
MSPVQNGESNAYFRLIGSLYGLPHMTPREVEEYKALRATIRERGTARHWIVVVGLASWAALTVAVAGWLDVPVATLVPLLVLVTTFEVIFALHTGVERVGRYLQVFFENAGDGERRWEHVAMQYGRTFGGGGIDALFSPIFWTATVFNLIPAMLAGPVAIDWAVVGGVHALFVLRVMVARRQSARQRAIDLERFEKIRKDFNV